MTNDIQKEITHQKHFKQFSQIFLCYSSKEGRFIHYIYIYNIYKTGYIIKGFSTYVRNVYSFKIYIFF